MAYNQKASDMTITCERYVFHVHSAVVCPQSTTLANAVDGRFQESTSNNINHGVFDPDTVARMLKYLYEKDYVLDVKLPLLHVSCHLPLRFAQDCASSQDAAVAHALEEVSLASTHEAGLAYSSEQRSAPGREASDPETLLAHVRVHAIAAYYDIPKLRLSAHRKFKAVLETPDGHLTLMDVIDVASELYRFPEKEDTGLRPATLKYTLARMDNLIQHGDFMAGLQRDDDGVREFCVDVIRSVADQLGKEKVHVEWQRGQADIQQSILTQTDKDRAFHAAIAGNAHSDLSKIARAVENGRHCSYCG
ncbi:hypothetical protein LTR36_000447 [Oleoguttula mirabilis]|uniref:BTB domain-containing protein n=1 Tax=Oleoguttula mirabilis TaxID=1507867 RepID=A0AAV9K0L5_9PEZI|nr:hypothetical protein LTR36_000447 [Oleoguttula mirabilis]